jgi:hypothetical protein
MYRIYNENAKTCNACNAVGFRSEIPRFPSLKCFQRVAKKGVVHMLNPQFKRTRVQAGSNNKISIFDIRDLQS